MQREIQDTPTLMGVPGRFPSSGLKRRRLPGLADRCPELIQERLADEENVRAVTVAAAALFFDGFEHVYHPGSLPKLRLSDILRLATCQEFFKAFVLFR